VLKVLAAIGSGIGVLGFVTLFGGAIIWLRADKAELPASEAVAVIPRNVLVTTGATFLIPAVLIGIAIVAVVFLIRLVFYVIQLPGLQSVREQAETFGREAAQRSRTAAAAQRAWQLADAALAARKEDLKQAHGREAPAPEIADLEAAVGAQEVEAKQLKEAAEGAASAASAARVTAEDLVEQSRVELKPGLRQWGLELTIAAIALLIVVPLVNGAVLHVEECWEFLLLALAGLSGTAVTLLIYRWKSNFLLFGVAAILAVGVYLSAATYLSTHRNAKMQPVAALWSGHAPVTGAFVAETSQNLYVGTFREEKTPPRLLVVPRAQVTQVEIGPLLDQEVARQRATGMAINECRQQVEEPATKQQPAKWKAACTPEQVEALTAKMTSAQAQLDQPG